jgi:phospholipid-binding lipoprotein MlaA
MKMNSWRLMIAALAIITMTACTSVSERLSHQSPPAADLISPPEIAVEAIASGVVRNVESTARKQAELPEEGFKASDNVSDGNTPSSSGSAARDPWEKFNRRMHRFNNAFDRSIARPVAKAYANAVPENVRSKVSNFFDNLGQPVTAVNALLQGKVAYSAQALGRFMVNSTVGVAGLFDPASRLSIPKREEDFGQTLAVWGWRRSRYLELPFFGPSTIRDAFGIAGDSPLQPTSYIESDKIRIGLTALNLVDLRARLLAFDSLREEVNDDYAFVRDAWSQRRRYQIDGDAGSEENLPDYLNDDNGDTTEP